MITRARSKVHAVIEEKLDPNEVTYKPDNDLMPAWIAVLRFRYMSDLPTQGYVSFWEDFKHGWSEEGDSNIHRLDIKYNDSVISTRPLHPELYLSKIRTFLCGVLRLTLHIYPQVGTSRQANVLVQGKDCREWVLADFNRLQEVVMEMMDRPSKQKIMETWQTIKPILTLPPCVDWAASPLPDDDTEEALALASMSRDKVTPKPLTPTPLLVKPPSLLAISWHVSDNQVTETSQPYHSTPSFNNDDTVTTSITCTDQSDQSHCNATNATAGSDLEHTPPASDRDETVTTPTTCTDQSDQSHCNATNATASSDPEHTPPASDSVANEVSQPPLSTPASHSGDTMTTPPTCNVEAGQNDHLAPPPVSQREEKTETHDVVTGSDPDHTPPPAATVTTDALLAMFHELRQEFDTYRAETQVKLEDQRVQLLNAQRAHSQQCCSAVDDISTRCTKQEGEISRLHKRCLGLEQSLKQLRKDCQSHTCLCTTPSPHSPVASAITVVTNNGRYGTDADFPLSPAINAQFPHAAGGHGEQTPAPTPSPPSPFFSDTPCSVTKQGDSSLSVSGYTQRDPTLRLAPAATRLVIGDSNLKDINRRRLNADGDIQVCTMRGARIETLQQVFSAMQPTSAIKRVVLHVGTNNIAGRQADTIDTCLLKYSDLLDAVSKKLPAATIAVSALPPLKPWMRSKTARQLNADLKDLCVKKSAVFLSHNALWATDNDGKLYPRVLKDLVHLSRIGLGMLLRETKVFFNGATTPSNDSYTGNNNRPIDGKTKGAVSNNTKTSYADAAAGRKPNDDAGVRIKTHTSLSVKRTEEMMASTASQGNVSSVGQVPPQPHQPTLQSENSQSNGGHAPPHPQQGDVNGQAPSPCHNHQSIGHPASPPLYGYTIIQYQHPPPHMIGQFPVPPQAGPAYGHYTGAPSNPHNQFVVAGGMPPTPPYPIYAPQWYSSVPPPLLPVQC